MSSRNLLALHIAGLEVILDARDSELEITVPFCHQKFLAHPETQESLVLTPTHSLYLSIENGPTYQSQASDVPVCVTDIWELWRRGQDELMFVSPRQDPPRSVIVDANFSHGRVVGPFSSTISHFYPISSIDIRILINWLATFGEILLHAAGVAIDGMGYCFMGNSGAGKSTLVSELGLNTSMTLLGEDQVVLRKINDQFWISGTPWHEHPDRCSPIGVPLKKIFYLDRFAPETLTELSATEGVSRILQTAFIPYYLPKRMPGIIDNLSTLTKSIPIYQLKHQIGADILPLILY